MFNDNKSALTIQPLIFEVTETGGNSAGVILLSPSAINMVLHGFSLGQLKRLFRVDCAIKFASASQFGRRTFGRLVN